MYIVEGPTDFNGTLEANTLKIGTNTITSGSNYLNISAIIGQNPQNIFTIGMGASHAHTAFSPRVAPPRQHKIANPKTHLFRQ